LQPIPAVASKGPSSAQPEQPVPEAPAVAKSAESASSDSAEDTNKPTPAPPLPPNTESPIPLNQFGLPPQVLPLGRIDPAYHGLNQIGPFRYTYPSLRFYDPFEPFSISPYVNLPPLYRPVSNVLEPSITGLPTEPRVVVNTAKEAPSTKAPASEIASQPSQSPPPEPSDLSVLNYSSNDPAIPNVPPPPLPQGGLKPDNSE
jgi:hypothetical protein